MCVCVYVCVCLRVCVCACEREREIYLTGLKTLLNKRLCLTPLGVAFILCMKEFLYGCRTMSIDNAQNGQKSSLVRFICGIIVVELYKNALDGTKPKTSRHRSPGGERRGKRKR